MSEVIRLTEEGTFDAVIVNAGAVESRFKEGEYQLKLEVLTPDNKSADIYLDMAEDYVGDSGRRRIDMTMDALKHLGIGVDISKLPTLKGKKVSIYGKKSLKGTVYYSFNFEKKVELSVAQARMNALLGNATGHSDPAAAPTKQARNVFEQPAADSEDIPF